MFYNHQVIAAEYEKQFRKLNPAQYQGLDTLLGFIEIDPDITDDRWVAYMLATVEHECAHTFAPIGEFGGDAYFTKRYDPSTVVGKRLGNTEPGDGPRFKGRGYVQITGRANYKRLGQALGVGDLFLKQPDLVMEAANAYRIMSLGMRTGAFTGKKLASYINDDGCDYVNARRIINGTDQADVIAAYATRYEAALKKARAD